MKKENSMKVVILDSLSETQMSVQRVTPIINDIPQQDEVCFLIEDYCEICKTGFVNPVIISIAEAKRLQGILEVMTMRENENFGIRSEKICK